MRIASFPSTGSGNPYIENFYNALKAFNINLVFTKRFTFSWIIKNRASYDAIHVHWLHLYYDNPSLIITLVKSASYVAKFLLLNLLGKKIIYTLHNLYPHSSRDHRIDKYIRVFTIRIASLVIVHSNTAKALATREFGCPSKYVVMFHGHYINNYPQISAPDFMRKKLRIASNCRVILFGGNVKSYKRVDHLISTFKTIKGEFKLIIAGRCDPSIRNKIHALAAEDSRIVLDDTFVSAENLEAYFSIADISVLPFSKTLTSGSLMLAYSFNCPVLIPDLLELREYHIDGLTHLYHDDLRAGIESTIMEVKRLKKNDWEERMEPFAWITCVRPVAEKLESI